jgi:hypothetical protein
MASVALLALHADGSTNVLATGDTPLNLSSGGASEVYGGYQPAAVSISFVGGSPSQQGTALVVGGTPTTNYT